MIPDTITTTPSTPASTISEKTSISDHYDHLPPNLASGELQLALNKEATEDDLIQAIEKCKELILDSSECSIERKWLVRHLIELRLRLQESNDAMGDPLHPRNKTSGVSSRTVKGHHLKLQPFLSYNPYCDHCTGTIWSVVQAWYSCQDCGYSCHYKCLGSIVRECAHVIVCEKGQYELGICPERGMSAQKYKCAECFSPFVLNNWSDIRRCDYSGLYYCSACHWDSSAIIPARVIHNWDMNPRPVSQQSLQILKITASRPLINLTKLNPQLFSRVHELDLVKRLRIDLQSIKKYLSVCRLASEQHLLWKCDRPHLIDSTDLYSLQDLVETQSGDLPTMLHQLIDLYLKHIEEECEVCRGRGHICEVCHNQQLLFPFSLNAVVCGGCQGVFHKVCMGRMGACPRCERRSKRESSKDE